MRQAGPTEREKVPISPTGYWENRDTFEGPAEKAPKIKYLNLGKRKTNRSGLLDRGLLREARCGRHGYGRLR